MARQLKSGRAGAVLVAVTSVVLAVVTVAVAVKEEPNRFAAAILQGITIVVSLVGAWAVSRADATEVARDIMRPHVSSAFRRVQTHWSALGRAHDAISAEALRLASLSDGRGKIPYDHVRASLVHLQAILVEQIATVEDSLTDWREILPGEAARAEAATTTVQAEGYNG